MVRVKTQLRCPRCAFCTDRLSTYKNHINRSRHPCKYNPNIRNTSDVIPTVDNVIREPVSTPAYNVITHNGAPSTDILGNNNTTTTTATTTTNIDQSTHLHNHVTINIQHPRPYHKSVLTHIPDNVWARVIDNGIRSGDLGSAVRDFIRLVHYNPNVPENMNMYFPEEDEADDDDAGKVLCYCRDATNKYGWFKLERSQAVRWMVDDAASFMLEFPHKYKSIAKQVENYYDALDLKKLDPPLEKAVVTDAISNSRQAVVIYGVERLQKMFEDADEWKSRSDLERAQTDP